MAISDTNVVLHVNEELGDHQVHEIERRLADEMGVLCACVNERARHLWIIDYDPEVTSSTDVLHKLRRQGLHAALVGGI